MRAVFQPSADNSPAVVLADDALYSATSELTVIDCLPEHTQAVQVDALTESDAPFIQARGNAQVSYSLLVLARFSSTEERYRYQDALMQKIRGQGELILTYANGARNTLRDAVCSGARIGESVGKTCTINYSFIGSALN